LAVASVKPSRIVLEPKVQNGPMPLLIALHGNMSHAAGFAPHWLPAADEGWLVAVPQSTQFGWANTTGVWTDNDRALAEVQQHYQELVEQYAVDTNRVVLAGFSMGGQVAMKMALAGTIPALGFIGVEGWVFGVENIPPLLDNMINSGLRSHVITGGNPRFADEAKAVVDLLRVRGLACQLEETANLYHDVSPDFPAVLGRALVFICGS
jgi:predicted esterase